MKNKKPILLQSLIKINHNFLHLFILNCGTKWVPSHYEYSLAASFFVVDIQWFENCAAAVYIIHMIFVNRIFEFIHKWKSNTQRSRFRNFNLQNLSDKGMRVICVSLQKKIFFQCVDPAGLLRH